MWLWKERNKHIKLPLWKALKSKNESFSLLLDSPYLSLTDSSPISNLQNKTQPNMADDGKKKGGGRKGFNWLYLWLLHQLGPPWLVKELFHQLLDPPCLLRNSFVNLKKGGVGVGKCQMVLYLHLLELPCFVEELFGQLFHTTAKQTETSV